MEDGEEELLDLEGEEEEMHEPALSLTVVEDRARVLIQRLKIERTKSRNMKGGSTGQGVFRTFALHLHKVVKIPRTD